MKAQRYRGEVDEDGTISPPKTRNVKPLEGSDQGTARAPPAAPKSALKTKSALRKREPEPQEPPKSALKSAIKTPTAPKPAAAAPPRSAIKSALKRRADPPPETPAVATPAAASSSAAPASSGAEAAGSSAEAPDRKSRNANKELAPNVAELEALMKASKEAATSRLSQGQLDPKDLRDTVRRESCSSEIWDGDDEEDPNSNLSRRHTVTAHHHQSRAPSLNMCPNEELAAPLMLDDDRPEAWSVRQLCRRAYYHASQRSLWACAHHENGERASAVILSGQGGLRAQEDGRERAGSKQLGVPERMMGRRCSAHQAIVALDSKLLTEPSSNDTASPPSGGGGGLGLPRPKIQRATSVFILDGEEESLLAAVEDKTSSTQLQLPRPPGETGAPKVSEAADGSAIVGKEAAAADTGGTPPLQMASPLKEVLLAKKVKLNDVRERLESMSKEEIEYWIDLSLDCAAELPTPLFFAVGATLPAVVGLLLEHSADVRKTFVGQKLYNGWIKPGATPIEAVTNRRGRFVGTMLGDRLDETLDILKLAEARYQEDTTKIVKKEEEVKAEIEEKIKKIVKKDPKNEARKSIKLAAARGTIEHTQGHPSEKYDVISELAEGTLSSVKEAIYRKTGEKRAIKAEMKVEEGIIWDEIAIMRKIYHPNVIQLFETFEDESNIFVVLELCSGGELFNRLAIEGGIPERDAARAMQQLASAVKYIHGEKICHRDIQPENFMLQDDGPFNEATVKLIDFTTAKEFGPGMEMKTKICTLHYVAPEILTRKNVTYTEQVDVWSLGVVFYVMLSGCPPFHAENELGILKRIKKGKYEFTPPEIWANISAEAKDLVERMLVVEVSSRFTAVDVCNHKWLEAETHNSKSQSKHTNHLVTAEQLNNLRNFHARNRVQKVVLRLRAQQLSDGAVEELREVFRRLDTSGTGEVHISQCRDKIRKIPALNEHIEEIMRVLWGLAQGTGKVNFEQFIKAMVERHRVLQKEACRAVFDVFDFDGSGTISKEELKMALGFGDASTTFRAGIETVFGMKADEIEGRFKLDNDEYSFDEFFDIMQKQVC